MGGVRLNPGEVFAEDFEVASVIGTGSMGIVYRATQLSSGRPIALKLMHPALCEDPKALHRFEREARALSKVRSQHVARVLCSGLDERNNQPWMAMDLSLGVNLDEFVQDNDQLDFAARLDVLHQLFAALSAAHDAGVVHRDLKPANIMVQASASPPLLKVLDFGIAKHLASATALSTSPGQGTPLWTAPEQSRFDDVPHPRADVWALGLLSFFVLTGKLFWRHAQGAMSMAKLSMELIRDPIPPACERARELQVEERLPTGFEHWFSRCVCRDPEGRFESAGAALRALTIVMNRRQSERHQLGVPVYADALRGGVAVTCDISQRGMLLLSRSSLPPETQLSLRLTLPPDGGKTFTPVAVVVRCTDNQDDQDGIWPFKVAVVFEKPLPGLEPILKELAGLHPSMVPQTKVAN